MIKIRFGSPEDSFYSQVDPRRRQEIYEARLIQEDQRAIANLPERPIYRTYNQNKFKHNQMKAASPQDVFNDEVGW